MRVKLGDIFEIGSGGTPSKLHPEYYDGNIPWVKTGDLKAEYLYEVEDYITEEGLINSSAKLYEIDTVLVAMYGATIGATSILKMPACTNQACAAFRKNERVVPEYLYYFLKSQKSRFVKDGVGGAQPNISARYLKRVQMELLSIDEQKAIVNILDKVTNVINKREEEIQFWDNLVKARFVEMFNETNANWKEVTIADICKDMRTGPFGSALHHDEFVDEGIFVLGIDNAVENKFSYNRMRYITEEKYEKLKRYTVHPGDVIITIMGTVGRSAVIPADMPKAINTKHLACLTPDTNIVDSYFLVNVFQIHPLIRHQLESQSKGAIMNGLNLTIIKGLKFRLPPLELQKEFVDFYKQIDKSKFIKEIKLSVFAPIIQYGLIEKKT